tara:strand:- start:1099 stop:1359 length:261 start_codon:yes stop_codon:yes gene_type:complete
MNALGEAKFIDVEARLATFPPVEVPAIVLRGEDSGFGRPSEDSTEDKSKFSNLKYRKIVPGAGHDFPIQRPDEVISALMALLKDNL